MINAQRQHSSKRTLNVISYIVYFMSRNSENCILCCIILNDANILNFGSVIWKVQPRSTIANYIKYQVFIVLGIGSTNWLSPGKIAPI